MADQEIGALTTAIAIVSGANPIIAAAVGIIGGIFGGYWSNKRRTKSQDEKLLDAAKEILKQQAEQKREKAERQLQRDLNKTREVGDSEVTTNIEGEET
jgi:FtsZ-interacting cell division protein ZipA